MNKTYLGLSLPWVTRTMKQSLRGWYRYCRTEMGMTVSEARKDCWSMLLGWSRIG